MIVSTKTISIIFAKECALILKTDILHLHIPYGFNQLLEHYEKNFQHIVYFELICQVINVFIIYRSFSSFIHFSILSIHIMHSSCTCIRFPFTLNVHRICMPLV
jgi:hypothetical protein